MKSKRYRKYSKELLEEAVKKSHSWAELFRNLDLPDISNGNHYRIFPKYCKEYDIDIAHFTGKLWNKGKTKETSTALKEGI
jgi:hypothetical protein